MSTLPPSRSSLYALLASHTLSRTGNVITVFAIPFAILGAGGAQSKSAWSPQQPPHQSYSGGCLAAPS